MPPFPLPLPLPLLLPLPALLALPKPIGIKPPPFPPPIMFIGIIIMGELHVMLLCDVLEDVVGVPWCASSLCLALSTIYIYIYVYVCILTLTLRHHNELSHKGALEIWGFVSVRLNCSPPRNERLCCVCVPQCDTTWPTHV